MHSPTNMEELRRFLGYINYLERFMPKLATITEPMRKLLTKGVEYAWTQEQEETFLKIKQLAQTSETLGYYDHTKPVVLQCDASTVGLDAVLLQEDKPMPPELSPSVNRTMPL